MAKKTNQEKKISEEWWHDVLPKEGNYWEYIYHTLELVSKLHGFNFFNPSVLEKFELYEKAYKEEEKEKLNEIFKLKIGKSTFALRYSFRENILRSFFTHKLSYVGLPFKVFYLGGVFRNGEVNEYFFKNFHQLGFQVLGEAEVFYDGEVITVMYDFLRRLKLKNLILKLGYAGCKKCRPIYKKKLQDYYYKHLNTLCKSCRSYFPHNVFKILECQKEKCLELKNDAPSVFNFICGSCNNYMKALMEIIEENEIPYEIDEHLTGRSSAETKEVFEFYVPQIPYSLGFGSRYDFLSEQIFGKLVPAVGGNIGVERTIQALWKQNIYPLEKNKPQIAFLIIGEQAKSKALKLMSSLRLSGIGVVEFASKKSLDSQMKTAIKSGIRIVVMIGQKEVFDNTVILKDMVSDSQEIIPADHLEKEIRKKLSQRSS